MHSPSRTEDEQREHLQRVTEFRDAIPENVSQLAATLESTVKRFDTFDLLAHLLLRNVYADPETYKEPLHRGNAAVVEYVSLLCLKSAYNHAHSVEQRSISDSDITDVQEQAEGILELAIAYQATESVDPLATSGPSAIDELRFKTILEQLSIRSPGYPDHQAEVLLELFLPFAEQLLATIGFTVDDAVAFSQAVYKLQEDRLAERAFAARAAADEIAHDLMIYGDDQAAITVFPEPFIEQLANLSPGDRHEAIISFTASWAFLALGDTFAFDAEELAIVADRNAETAATYLSTFALEFGSIPPDYCLPSPIHQLKTAPFLTTGNRYLCVAPHFLIWGLQPKLEEALKPSWESYNKHRSRLLERRTMEAIQRAMPCAQVFRDLKYRPQQGKATTDCQLDGMAIFDSNLFLVECKAGGFSEAGRRGNRDRMRKKLRELVSEPHSQALRARQYIWDSDTADFSTQDGQSISVDRRLVDNVFMVTTTLEPLEVFTTALARIADADLLASTDYPWAVWLLDLEIIGELTRIPSQFPHYMMKRRDVAEDRRIDVFDELDLFGHYLKDGLEFDECTYGSCDRVSLVGYTSGFDEYYAYKYGQRTTPAEPPTSKMPGRIRQAILEIEADAAPGYTKATFQLLNLDSRQRTQLVAMWRHLLKKTKNDRRPHDFSMVDGDRKAGLTIFVAPGKLTDEMERRMFVYCLVKKHQQKCDKWVGILSLSGMPGVVHHLVASDEPWQHDETIEGVIQGFFP